MNNNKKCEKEWKEIIKNVEHVKSGSVDDEIEIVIVDTPAPSQPSRSDALSFWLSRVKHKNKEKCINLDEPLQPSSALYQSKITIPATKTAIPIVSHDKQKDRTQPAEVINVEEANAKMNLEKYKKAIFRTEEKKVDGKPYVESQQSKKRRFQRQIQIIESINMPRWKEEKMRRQENNRFKYPLSSTASYGYDHHPNTRAVDTFDEVSWANFQRNREIEREKNRQKKQEERRKEKEKKEELKLQKKREMERQFLEFADGLLGTKKQKIEGPVPEDPFSDTFHQDNAEENGLPAEENPNGIIRNGTNGDDEQQTIRRNIEIEDGQIQNSEYAQIAEPKAPRYGIKDIIKTTQSPYASEVVRAVLAHNYARPLAFVDNKKIPDIFQDASAYKRVFHYLIANQSIADVAQRMQRLVRDGQRNPIKVTITNRKVNHDGNIEILLQEVNPDGKSHALKSCSLSRLRIGLLTNQVDFRQEHYGFSDNCESFGMLVILVTPESKDQMGAQVKVLGKGKLHQLQMALRRKGNEAYFFDLDKLTTNYREYQAVSNMQYSDLAPVLLNPQLMERQMKSFVARKDIIANILTYLQSIFNQTQWESIREMVLKESGIVLLQGPPGTGKTSTLMGLLSAQYEYLKRTGDNRKIMICAPSNAAVDHIVKRLQKEGLFNGEGEIIFPNVLRVGIVETMDQQVRAVSLDDLVEKKMIQQDIKANEERRLTTAQIKEKLIAVQKQLKRAKQPGNEKRWNELKQEEIRYEGMLFTFRSEKMVTARKHYTYYENQQLDSAQIILATLSSSGNEKLDRLRGEIACLIIDEAAQTTQPNLLIALQTGVQKVLLIGDPYQLPATCMSPDCNITLFNRSLFQRFIDANIKPYFLNIQYRMAPLIRYFPSHRFYHSRLVDAASVVDRPKPNFLDCFNKRNVVFLDVKYGRELQRGDSHMNEAEGRTVGRLVQCLLQSEISMGIITPYQAQRAVIARQCKAELSSRIPEEVQIFEKNVMINTVDSFQGQERDVIIVSTVRANNRQHLGFLTDQRRINVTLTRAKFLLIIVGHADTLGGNEVWNDFLNWAETEKIYYQLNSPQQMKEVLASVFRGHNNKAIMRKRYNQFSTDVRRKDRSDIGFNLKTKKAHDKISQKGNGQSEEGPSSEQKEKSAEDHRMMDNNEFEMLLASRKETGTVSKYALDIKESEKIREEKLLKEREMEDFQAMTQRMAQLQQLMKKDSTYKDIFL